jgi:hypothetical protein
MPGRFLVPCLFRPDCTRARAALVYACRPVPRVPDRRLQRPPLPVPVPVRRLPRAAYPPTHPRITHPRAQPPHRALPQRACKRDRRTPSPCLTAARRALLRLAACALAGPCPPAYTCPCTLRTCMAAALAVPHPSPRWWWAPWRWPVAVAHFLSPVAFTPHPHTAHGPPVVRSTRNRREPDRYTVPAQSVYLAFAGMLHGASGEPRARAKAVRDRVRLDLFRPPVQTRRDRVLCYWRGARRTGSHLVRLTIVISFVVHARRL